MPSDRNNSLVNFTSNKYNLLLVCLFVVLMTAPFAAERGLFGLLLPLVFLVLLVTALYSFLNSQTLFLYLMLGGVLFFLQAIAWLNEFAAASNLKLAIATGSIDTVFMTLSIYFIIGEIFSRETITSDAIKGGIVVYVLLGILWFEIYRTLAGLRTNSFSTNEDFELLHFSFITLTTVGYGDILPLSKLAKILANLEGIVGVIYPTIFIARLLGLYERDSYKK